MLKAEEYSSKGAPVISVGEIREGCLEIGSKTSRVSDETIARLPRFLLRQNDIIFGRKGSTHGNALIKKGEEGFFLGSDGIRLRVNDESICPKYWSYQLRSARAVSWLKANSEGTTMHLLNQDILSRFSIRFLPVADQTAIAHILNTLDDKSELNRKTSETLEAMAKALLKSWFVDFDPVRAKAEGRSIGLPSDISDLFPGSFEDSELGEIPIGWGTTCLDELTSFVIGGDWGKYAWRETEQPKVLCLRGADITSLQPFAMGKPPTRFLMESSCEKRTLVDGDIVLERSGGSTDQSTGRPVLISSELIKRAQTPLSCSSFCRLILFGDPRWSPYAYYLVLSLYQIGEMFQYEAGATGIKNFGYKYFEGGRFFPKPPNTLLDLFHCQLKSLHSSCHRRGEESDLLSKTRDALLPKLISGEIRIPDAEKILEEVGI